MTKVMPYSLDKIMYGKGIVHREVIFMLFNANIQCFNTSTFVQLLPTLYWHTMLCANSILLPAQYLNLLLRSGYDFAKYIFGS